jgi:hypothetical protein
MVNFSKQKSPKIPLKNSPIETESPSPFFAINRRKHLAKLPIKKLLTKKT